MTLRFFLAINLLILPFAAHSASSFYCPQRHAYINVGMTQAQVTSACGQPTSVRASSTAVVQQIPVTQLIYTTLNQGAISYYPGLDSTYSMWSLASGSHGSSVEVNLINNQITSMKINGSGINALSVCENGSVQIGDDITKVFNACGAPSNINKTYINKSVPESAHPQVWFYTVDQYQPTISLTFINGILQSIN
ncbi:MAG: DUF2845 domain-containing protein [Legionellaceae bacterium]|nr:DUF2845 domain-containing protein [Legionellaceae bacterium]